MGWEKGHTKLYRINPDFLLPNIKQIEGSNVTSLTNNKPREKKGKTRQIIQDAGSCSIGEKGLEEIKLVEIDGILKPKQDRPQNTGKSGKAKSVNTTKTNSKKPPKTNVNKDKRILVPLEEFAEMLDMTRQKLKSLAVKGKIPCYNPKGRNIYFKLEDLLRYIESSRVKFPIQ